MCCLGQYSFSKLICRSCRNRRVQTNLTNQDALALVTFYICCGALCNHISLHLVFLRHLMDITVKAVAIYSGNCEETFSLTPELRSSLRKATSYQNITRHWIINFIAWWYCCVEECFWRRLTTGTDVTSLLNEWSTEAFSRIQTRL